MYRVVMNNLIERFDLLGLKDGCVKRNTPPLDFGWEYQGPMPDGSFIEASNGGLSDGAVLIYQRTITHFYDCICSCGKSLASQKKLYRTSANGASGDEISWTSGPGGPWPPLPLWEDLLQYFADNLIYAPSPISSDLPIIERLARDNKPPNSVQGNLKKQDPIPTCSNR